MKQDLDRTKSFKQLQLKLRGYTESLPLVLHNKEYVLKTLLDAVQEQDCLAHEV